MIYNVFGGTLNLALSIYLPNSWLVDLLYGLLVMWFYLEILNSSQMKLPVSVDILMVLLWQVTGRLAVMCLAALTSVIIIIISRCSEISALQFLRLTPSPYPSLSALPPPCISWALNSNLRYRGSQLPMPSKQNLETLFGGCAVRFVTNSIPITRPNSIRFSTVCHVCCG